MGNPRWRLRVPVKITRIMMQFCSSTVRHSGWSVYTELWSGWGMFGSLESLHPWLCQPALLRSLIHLHLLKEWSQNRQTKSRFHRCQWVYFTLQSYASFEALLFLARSTINFLFVVFSMWFTASGGTHRHIWLHEQRWGSFLFMRC